MFCNKNKSGWDDFDKLRGTVKNLVGEKRYIHTLGVEEEAVKIAGIFERGKDFIKKLRSAAILHDITKEFDIDKQYKICDKYKINLSYGDKKSVKPIHARTAAYIAKIEFGADDVIFDGIYNHTVMEPSKSFDLFNRIIYLADWTEPNRDDEDCAGVRRYFYAKIKTAKNLEEKQKVLDETMLFSANTAIKILTEENLFIHEDTLKCRNALIIKEITV